MRSFRSSQPFGLFLSLLVPGLGHLYWREWLFGLFIFLVTLIAAALFFASWLVPFGIWVKLILIGLPLVFYLFTFVDLFKTVVKKRGKIIPGRQKAYIFLAVGVLFQTLVPLAPVNFLIHNRPDYFIQENNEVAPLYARGDYLKASSLAYCVKLFFVDRPLYYSLPDRYDVVRFVAENDRLRTGIVVGLPGEEIEIIDGTTVVNGVPDWNGPRGWSLTGDAGLTRVDGYSILIATLKFGVIDRVHEVSIDNLAGRVSRIP